MMSVTKPPSEWTPDEITSYLSELSALHFRERLPSFILNYSAYIVGAFGNSLTFIIYLRCFPNNSTRIFILGMSVVDIIMNVLAAPLASLINMYFYSFYDTVACQIFFTLIRAMTMSSIFLLGVVAFDRYQHVCRPFKQQLSPRGALYLVLLACAAGTGVGLPFIPMFGIHAVATTVPGINGSNCAILADGVSVIYKWADEIANDIVFLITLVFMLFSYGKIFIHIRLAKRALARQKQLSRKTVCQIAIENIDDGVKRSRLSLVECKEEIVSIYTDDSCFAVDANILKDLPESVPTHPEDSASPIMGSNRSLAAPILSELQSAGSRQILNELPKKDDERERANHDTILPSTTLHELPLRTNSTLPEASVVHKKDKDDPAKTVLPNAKVKEMPVKVKSQLNGNEKQTSTKAKVNTNLNSIEKLEYLPVEEDQEITSVVTITMSQPTSGQSSSSLQIPSMTLDNPNKEISERGLLRKIRNSVWRQKGDSNEIAQKRRTRTTLIMFVLTVLYCVNFLPYVITMSITPPHKIPCQGLPIVELNFCEMAIYYFPVLNSVVNPFVYSMFSYRFRQECKRYLCWFRKS